MSLLSFYKFEMYCPTPLEETWGKLVDVTEEHPLVFGLKGFFGMGWQDGKQYYGRLEQYRFKLRAISSKRFISEDKYFFSGNMESLMGGCSVQIAVWPTLSMALSLLITAAALLGFVGRQIYEAQGFSFVGFFFFAGFFGLILAHWISTVRKQRRLFFELFGGQSLTMPPG